MEETITATRAQANDGKAAEYQYSQSVHEQCCPAGKLVLVAAGQELYGAESLCPRIIGKALFEIKGRV